MVLDTVKGIFNIDWRNKRLENLPLHVAMTMNGIPKWAQENKKTEQEAYKKSFHILNEIFKATIDNKIRVLTIYFMPKFRSKDKELIAGSIEFINSLAKDKLIHDNQVKISILGKWYDLPSELVEPIKNIISETKDYDNFFINFCMNYSGRDEIVDVCKLLGMKIKADKLDPEAISKDMIKENLYTSYFVPPDIIIKTGLKAKLFGFMMWDTILTDIYFVKKWFPEFSTNDFLKIVQSWKRDEDFNYNE